MLDQPLISVVTPVYNGGKFLAECIESVLAQSHRNLEHVILDNASTDETAAIVARFAARDPRVRVSRNDETLWVIDNWNRALEGMSPDARYCKILHADDTLQPDCLEKMVGVALRHPSIGVVGALRLRGDRVECRGLPREREVFDGGEVVRMYLRQEVFALAPTSALIRADLVRDRQPFYPSEFLHADLAVMFDLLASNDFGFVHEVLSFSRTHADSITSTVAERRKTLFAEWLPMLHRYGPAVLSAEDLRRIQDQFLRRYYRLLVRSFLTRRDRAFMDYHLSGLRKMGLAPGVRDVGFALGAEAAASVANPGKLYRHLAAGFGQRQRPMA